MFRIPPSPPYNRRLSARNPIQRATAGNVGQVVSTSGRQESPSTGADVKDFTWVLVCTSLRISDAALFSISRLQGQRSVPAREASRRASVRRRPFPPAGNHHQHVVAKEQQGVRLPPQYVFLMSHIPLANSLNLVHYGDSSHNYLRGSDGAQVAEPVQDSVYDARFRVPKCVCRFHLRRSPAAAPRHTKVI